MSASDARIASDCSFEAWDQLLFILHEAKQCELKVSLNFGEADNTEDLMRMIDFTPDRVARATKCARTYVLISKRLG